MSSNVRPESMERITTPELAQKFIDEQIILSVAHNRIIITVIGYVRLREFYDQTFHAFD